MTPTHGSLMLVTSAALIDRTSANALTEMHGLFSISLAAAPIKVVPRVGRSRRRTSGRAPGGIGSGLWPRRARIEVRQVAVSLDSGRPFPAPAAGGQYTIEIGQAAQIGTSTAA